ncbi:hypothetical protein FHT87_002423 [Rhizobium sp. BK316]|uniref:hypothetical protein n=1 Tax=Rhizobium sp. BK316 TaxID=2587053 RepID=UPI001617A5E0|nr:hypothetical protein [Rhizobium sp. BK316]MBB3408520.1 hypothetical protein [Rhizobium sp. BK316]
MKTVGQIQKEEYRKSRHAAERWRKWIKDLRRRQIQQQERDRRRRWLLALLLALLESKPVQAFFPLVLAEPDPPQQKRQPQPPRKSPKKDGFDQRQDQRTEYDRLYLSDCSTRYGEEHLEVYDGLTWGDIIKYNREHRPWLFPAFTPIPGMPDQYKDEPVHIWTLFDHLASDYHRPAAIEALKLVVDTESHDWVDACAAETNGLTWKDLRRQCRRRTPEMTIREFPRAAARWREELRREAEERKKEAKETLKMARSRPASTKEMAKYYPLTPRK